MPDSIAATILRNMGMIGSPSAFSSLIPTAPNPKGTETARADFINSGDIADPDIWQKYSMSMKRPVTFESMLQLWDEMSGWDLMAAALVEVVDECLQTDENFPRALQFECNDSKFEDDLNDMLLNIDAEQLLPSQVWYTAGFGNAFEKLDYAKGEGVTGMNFVHPMDVRRYWIQRNRRCVGFRWREKKADRESAFAYADGTPIPRVGIDVENVPEDLWYPWDFLHFRRLYRLRFTEHGEPIFDEAQGIYKKLRMALDQMCVFRAQIQPDRYVVNIDTKQLPPREQLATVQRWKQSLRSKLSFGAGTPNTPDEFKSFYNAWGLDTILWMAKPEGYLHTVEKLAGTTAVPDIYDIELLQNLFFSIIGMPKWWVMGQKDGAAAPSGKALLASDIRFLRKIKALRRPITETYTWLGYFHAMLKGKDLGSLDIRAIMPPIGSLEDQAKLDLLGAQANVLASLGGVMEAFKLPREAWIEIIFKKYMHLPDDVVDVFMTALPPAVGESAVDTGRPGQGSMPTAKLLAEIDRKIGGSPGLAAAAQRIKNALNGKLKEGNHTKYKSVEAVLGFATKSAKDSLQEGTDGKKVQRLIAEGDVIQSSYGNDEKFVVKPKGEKLTEEQTKEPAYRRYMR